MTDEQVNAYHENLEAAISKYGYYSTFVFADSTPSFCYSTGVYKNFGIPEIFVSALPQNLSHEIIEKYVNKFKVEKSIPLNEKIDDLTDRFPVYFIEVPKDKLKDYALANLNFYKGQDFKYVQLIYPDTNGHFPNDIGYDYDQILMAKFES